MPVGKIIHVAGAAYTVETSLAISLELIELRQVLRGVLVELEKACGVCIYICVSKVVQLVTQCLLDVLSKLWAVFFLMHIEFASGVLELVSRGCFGALGNNFVNSTL